MMSESSAQSDLVTMVNEEHRDGGDSTAIADNEDAALESGTSIDMPVSDVSAETLEKLTYGTLANCLPQMQKAKSTLEELTENQRILIETVQQENVKFSECEALTEVLDVMETAKVYQGKLLKIKKDMLVLHDKSAKIKKRALKLQQQRQKEALQQEQDRERQLEKERQLVAKPASKQSKAASS